MQRATAVPRIVLFSAIVTGLPMFVGAQPATAGVLAARSAFAGYITSPTTITSAADSVTMPSFSCTRKTSAVVAVATVYQASGAMFSSAQVYVGCSKKQETLVAYAEINNVYSLPTATINPGDVVALSATCGASGVSVTIHDTTNGSTGTASSATAESCTQAEDGDGAVLNSKGTGLVSLPPFGMLNFTGAMVNGAALGTLSPTLSNYSEGKKNMITTGALTSGGTAFTTTRAP